MSAYTVNNFSPTHENVFEDAKLRHEDRHLISLNKVMHNATSRTAYCRHFSEQLTLGEVPESILNDWLLPYMNDASHMYIVFMDLQEEGVDNLPRGYFLGATRDGALVEVVGVDPFTERPAGGLGIPVVHYDAFTMSDFARDYCAGHSFVIERDAPLKEVKRRFWILVFNRVFGCAWWHVKSSFII